MYIPPEVAKAHRVWETTKAPAEHPELPDDVPEDNTIQSGTFTVYADDVNHEKIYDDLHQKKCRTITRQWEIVWVTLAQMREDNTKGGDSLYLKDIFPSSWTDAQILKFYMERNNTIGTWLPHDGDFSRNRTKLITSPEASTTE